jgi:hypothetical protein
VFAPLKAAYRKQVNRLEQGGVNIISKEHFISLYSPARKRVFTLKNIKAGFAAYSLFPFNPDRVLRDMPKLPAKLLIPKADNENAASYPQDPILQTPTTPISAEALMLLQNLIIKQAAHAAKETSKQSLQRHIQKFSKAAQRYLAKYAL